MNRARQLTYANTRTTGPRLAKHSLSIAMSAENVHRYAFASADRYQRLTGAEQTTGFAGGRDWLFSKT